MLFWHCHPYIFITCVLKYYLLMNDACVQILQCKNDIASVKNNISIEIVVIYFQYIFTLYISITDINMSNGAAIKGFLQEQGIEVTENLLKTLEDFAVKEISDLNLLCEEDFKNAGMSLLVPDYSYVCDLNTSLKYLGV